MTSPDEPRRVYATGGFELRTVISPDLDTAKRVQVNTVEYNRGSGMTLDDVEVWSLPVTEDLTFEMVGPKVRRAR